MEMTYTLLTNDNKTLKKLNDSNYIFDDNENNLFYTKDRFLLEKIRIESYYYFSNQKIKYENIFLVICNEDTKEIIDYVEIYYENDDVNFMQFETKPIGGGNPYYCCSSCGISVPQINGYLNRHSESCAFREEVEDDIVEQEKLKYNKD